MILRVAPLLVVLSGCDAVFNLDHAHPPTITDATDAPPPCFVETFDDGTIDPARWDVLSPGNATVAISEETGGVVARITPGTVAYNGLYSKTTFDMVGGAVDVRVTPAYTGGFVETIFTLHVTSTTHFLISVGASNFNMRATINNTPMPMLIAFDAAQMKFWRFEHDANADTITTQTSADRITWTDRMTVAVDYQPTAAVVELVAGAYHSGLPAATMARWENLRVTSPACP